MYRRAFALIGAGIFAVASSTLFGAGTASADISTGWLATLKPITANKVTGSGTGWITLTGNTAEFTVQISGLIKASHPSLIFIDGKGTCPTQATIHNGKPSVDVTDGSASFGSTVGAALTTKGDTSGNSAVAMDRFPANGSYTYQRTFDLSAATVSNLKKGTAVMVVHGIDYNGNGKFDNVLGASELAPSLPAEATDPAICGAFVSAQMPAVPHGSANTGGGSTAVTTHPVEMAIGGAALVGALGAGVVAYRRRRSTIEQ